MFVMMKGLHNAVLPMLGEGLAFHPKIYPTMASLRVLRRVPFVRPLLHND